MAGVIVRDRMGEVVMGATAYGGGAFAFSSRYNRFLIRQKLIHDPRDDGTVVIMNEAVHGGRTLATNSKVPGRIKGRHEAYRKLTGEEHKINAARHGCSEFADVTLALDGQTYFSRTQEGGGAATGGTPPALQGLLQGLQRPGLELLAHVNMQGPRAVRGRPFHNGGL